MVRQNHDMTCERQAKSFIYLSDPKYRGQYLRIAETEIDQLLEGATPRLIDEWQDIPELWDAIRHKVDHRDGMGQYLLTGSSVIPDKSKKKIRHSGTGRYSWLKMRPMSLWESGESSGEVSIAALFAKQDFTVARALERKLSETAFSICRGGWPLAVDRSGASALRLVRDYCRAVVESDISRFDDIPRDPERVRNLMRSYARLQGTQASVASIRKDMMQHDDRSLSEDTIHSYLKALKGIFVIEDASAWCPELRAKDTVRTSDTRYFTDPSIATASLGVTPDGLMNDLRSFGFFFEGMVIRDLRIYMDALDGSVRHYHDKTGLECDAVMHTWSGAYALAEIKLGGEKLVEEGKMRFVGVHDQKMGGLHVNYLDKYEMAGFSFHVPHTGEVSKGEVIGVIGVCVWWLMRYRHLRQARINEELSEHIRELNRKYDILSEHYDHAITTSAKHDESMELTTSDREFLERTVNTIYQLIREGQPDAVHLAEQMDMSLYQLRQRLDSVTGEKPQDFIAMVRMRRARHLLDTHPELNISEIATLCAYNDTPNFTRAFKKTFGLTPTNYLERQRNADPESL